MDASNIGFAIRARRQRRQPVNKLYPKRIRSRGLRKKSFLTGGSADGHANVGCRYGADKNADKGPFAVHPSFHVEGNHNPINQSIRRLQLKGVVFLIFFRIVYQSYVNLYDF